MIHYEDIVIAMSEAELKSIVNVMGQSGEGFEEYEQLVDILGRFQGAAKNYTS